MHAPNRLDDTAQATALVAPSRPGTREAYRRVYRRIAVTDALAVILALALSFWIVNGEIPTTGDFVLRLVGTAAAIVAVFAAFHLYEAFRYTPAEEFRRIILAVTFGVAGLMIVSFWSRADYSRLWVALSLGFAVVFTLIARRIWHSWIGAAAGLGRAGVPHADRGDERGGRPPGGTARGPHLRVRPRRDGGDRARAPATPSSRSSVRSATSAS